MAAPMICVYKSTSKIVREYGRLAASIRTHLFPRTYTSNSGSDEDPPSSQSTSENASSFETAESQLNSIPFLDRPSTEIFSNQASIESVMIEPEKETRSRRWLCLTGQSDPREHSVKHKGLFYKVSPEGRQFYESASRKQYLRSCVAFNEMGVMIRKPALEVFKYLEAANYSLPAIRYGIYGQRGCGKSLTLCHIIHRCSADGWLIVHHPYFANSMRTRDGVELSPQKHQRIDTPADAQKWLKYFAAINQPLIKELNLVTQEHYTFTKKEQTEVGTPWLTLTHYAQERPKFACDVIGIFVKEIKEQARQGKIKVLVALDGANALYDEYANIRTQEDYHKFYKVNDLSIAHSFRKLVQNDWNNAAIVCVLDKGASNPPKRSDYLPLELLGKKGFDAMDPFIPIEVTKFSGKEAHNFFEYLENRKFLQHSHALTPEGQQELLFLSESNPYELYNCALRW